MINEDYFRRESGESHSAEPAAGGDHVTVNDMLMAYMDKTNQEQIALRQEMRDLQMHTDHRLDRIEDMLRSNNEAANARMDRMEEVANARMDRMEEVANARMDRMDAKMDSVVEAIASMRGDIMDIRQEIVGVKEDIVGVKEDIVGVKEEVVGVKEEVVGVKEEVVRVKEEVVGVKQDALDRATEQRRYITTTVWTAAGAAAAGLGVLITWLLR